MGFRSDAEKQRQEWLTRQYAADCASLPAGVTETEFPDPEGLLKRQAALAAAREAVWKAALDRHRAYCDREGWNPNVGHWRERADKAFWDACVALDKLERA